MTQELDRPGSLPLALGTKVGAVNEIDRKRLVQLMNIWAAVQEVGLPRRDSGELADGNGSSCHDGGAGWRLPGTPS
jgi:hypothetical protein